MQKASKFFNSKYAPFVTVENVDGAEFGNWVKADGVTVENETSNGVFKVPSGSKKLKILFRSEGGGDGFKLTLNGDTGANYTYQETYGAHTANQSCSSYYVENQDGIRPILDARWADIAQCAGEWTIDVSTGMERAAMFDGHVFYPGGTYHGFIKTTAMWSNTTDGVETIEWSASKAFTGSIELYAWQEVTPIELHSYELVKEYNLNDEMINDTIPWDGEADGEIMIVVDGMHAGTNSAIVLQINEDEGMNYTRQRMQANNTSISSSRNTYNFFYVTYNSYDSRSEMRGNLKVDGGWRTFIKNQAYENTGDNTLRHLTGSCWWKNKVDPVTSITLKTYGYVAGLTPTSFTGTIKVYRLAKSHLITTNPGLLNNMWQKSTGTDSIEVAPGEIEINGTVCTNSKPAQVTLSGDLRASETKTANTYYYLYAVKGSGRTISFKFSAAKPTLDRYGNTVDFEGDDLYHPTEGRTWRYIGQVWNDQNSEILQFERCRPGYWEGTYNTFTVSAVNTLSHGLGRKAIRPRLLFKLPVGDAVHLMGDFYVTEAGNFGVYWRDEATETSLTPFFSAKPFRDATGHQDTGTAKLIVEDK